jgi:hypothetical protein
MSSYPVNLLASDLNDVDGDNVSSKLLLDIQLNQNGFGTQGWGINVSPMGFDFD